MAGPTKMIIITSNEDIIRQFSLNKATDTHIIHLANDKQMTTAANDNNNIMDMALLAELSELNSNNDHVYKRALDSPNHNRSKPVKVLKTSTDSLCKICGDRAIGFSYDVLSCRSCKSFFHRNAHQNIEKLRCFTGQGQCSVTHDVRRRCQRCRLNRCFAMGMRKDFVLTEEDNQKRRERLEENRNNLLKRSSTSNSTNSTHNISNSESISQALDEIDRLLMDIEKEDDNVILDNSTDPNEMEDISLTAENWITIQNIRSSFLSIFENDIENYSSFDASDHTSALIFWTKVTSQTVLRFISFFRQIDEFEGLHADDRFILIKYNLFPIFPICKCYHYRPMNGSPSYKENEKVMRDHRFYTLLFEPNDIRDIFTKLVVSLIELTERDPVLLSLLLTILIFTQGLSMNEDEPALKDSLAVSRAQLHYTRLLWNYMVNKYGETETCKKFTKLLTIIFEIQLAIKMFRDYFRTHLASPSTVEQIEPLMQTVIHIS